MAEVPDLAEHSATVVRAVLGSLVVTRAAATDVRSGTVVLLEGGLNVAERVRGLVTRLNTSILEPLVGRQAVVVHGGRLEELNDVLVLLVMLTVARGVKGTVTSTVFAELVGPESLVALALRHPEGLHPLKKVVAAKVLHELVHARAVVLGHRLAVHNGRGRLGVVLTVKVTVLRVVAVAKVRPETVQGPVVLREDLTILLAASVSVPKLGRENKTTVGLLAARVDVGKVKGSSRARHDRLLQRTGVVRLTRVRVELSLSHSSQGNGNESTELEHNGWYGGDQHARFLLRLMYAANGNHTMHAPFKLTCTSNFGPTCLSDWTRGAWSVALVYD